MTLISRLLIRLLPVLIALLICPAASQAETPSRDQLQQRLETLESSMPELDRVARSTLEELGEDSRREYIERRDGLDDSLEEWNQELSVGIAGDIDIQARRQKLKEDLKFWTQTIDYWNLGELQQAVTDAQAIARADGLDVPRLDNLYKITKQIVRTADFVPPNSTEFLALDRINLTTADRLSNDLFTTYMTFFGLGFALEELEAKARAEHQEYRRRMYKRVLIAYLRALISGDEEVIPCWTGSAGTNVPAIPGDLKLLGCPDPVLEKLKAYAQAVQKIQSADADMFRSQYDMLVAKQQLVSDVMSAAPLVGEVLDVYGILFGQDIAGQCLSAEEQGMAAVFLALPFLGSGAAWAVRQIELRSPMAASVLANMRLVFEVLSEETGSVLSGFYRERGIDLMDILAGKMKTTPDVLKKSRAYLESFRPGMDVAAQGRMTTFRTVRNAVESRQWRDQLPPEALEEAVGRSGKVVKENLGGYQMSRTARIKASNLVPDHIPALEGVAKERGEILIIRYVNPASADLIGAGAATKHMGIKGKSANRGPIRALLPVNQSLNKQGSRLEDLMLEQKKRTLNQVEKDEVNTLLKGMASGETSVSKCLQDPDCAMAIEYPVRNPAGEGDVILQVARDSEKERMVYFVNGDNGRKLDPMTGEPIEIAIDPAHPPEPVVVLADPKTGAPLTADYDFLALGVKGEHGVPRFDPQTGYVTQQMNETIEATNEAVAVTQRARGLTPQKVTHHGAERWYPFSPGALDVDPFVTVFDPDAGLMRIPRCESDCMKAWCKNTGFCNPAAICAPKTYDNCIPPDHDRLLKDYYHDRRLADYDLSPNSVWSWGHYNEGGGWSFSSYLESLRQKQVKTRLARDNGEILMAPGKRISVPNAIAQQSLSESMAARLRANITGTIFKNGLPQCTQRAE